MELRRQVDGGRKLEGEDVASETDEAKATKMKKLHRLLPMLCGQIMSEVNRCDGAGQKGDLNSDLL
jgi:hypothetical protein